jgi:uncharacterized protein (TIRG00374 family)
MKRRLFTVAKLFISLGLIFLLYHKIPLEDMAAVLTGANFLWLLPIVVLILACTVISAAKWRMFLQSDGINLPLTTLTASYLIGSFYNMFLPSNIGGDSYRIVDVAGRSQQTARTAVSVLADRLSGLLAMVCLGVVSSMLVGSRFGNPWFFLIPLTLLAAMLLVLWSIFAQKPFNAVLSISHLENIPLIRKVADKLLLSASVYGADRRLLVRAMLLSFLFQFFVCTIVYMLSQVIHCHTGFVYFCMFIPLVTLIETLPISINGIGLRDAGYIFFFGSVGMGELETRSLALLFLALTTSYSTCGGLVYLHRLLTTGDKKQKPPTE